MLDRRAGTTRSLTSSILMPSLLSTKRRGFPPGLLRTGALLLLACLLAGQFAATTHEFTALHAVCPRHGDLLEIDGWERPVAAASTSADPQHRMSLAGWENSQTRHQHCLFVFTRGNQKNLRLIGWVAASLTAALHWAPAAFSGVLHPALAVYRTAPKNSPPAA